MSSCEGFGTCFEQCCCTCFEDDDCEIPMEVCTCGHRAHTNLLEGEYCQTECSHGCKLVECHNFKLCGKKEPKWFLNCHNGMCLHCAVMIGRIKFLDEKDDCPICMETKDVIQVSCGKHKVCVECWKQLSETPGRPVPLRCPMCRESIWARKTVKSSS
jgi:hypothetical protein